jgi:hypothetical protein
MKALNLILLFSCIATIGYSQLPPTGNPPAAAATATVKANRAWYRGGNNNNPANNFNIFGSMWNSPVYHYTNGSHRMTLFEDTWNNAGTGNNTSTPFGGGLAINLNPLNPITRPDALLHLGENRQPGGGWRNWMQVGTFMTFDTDNMYVGLKQEFSTASTPDRADAVINWGDNTNFSSGPNQFGPDYLRFIFTAPLNVAGFGPGNAQDGLEIMRMAPNSYVGIGNFFNDPNFPFTHDPARRLEIFSDRMTVPGMTGVGNPQLRLTFEQQDPANPSTTGKFTDFHTTLLGDCGILSRDNTLVNNATLNLQERFVGINTNAPQNTLEVNSQYTSPCLPNSQPQAANFGAPTGWAGLRFSDLTSGCIPQANPGQGVLSVDANGDVIYVPTTTVAPAASSIGNYCVPGPSNALTGDYEIPLGGFRYYFPGQNPAANNQDIVSVGYNCGSNPPARFSVLEAQTPAPNINTFAGHFQNNDLTTTANAQVIGGVYGEAKGNIAGPAVTPQINCGGVFEGNNSWSSIGVMGRTLPTTIPAPLAGPSRYAMGGAFMSQGTLTNTNLPPAISNYGVWAKAENAMVSNIGVYAESVPDPNGIATGYAVYANAGINHNSGTGGDWAGYFDGDVFTTSSGYYTSDKNLKKDITTMKNSMDIINKLNPVTFNFDKEGNKQMNLASGLQYGFISQEVKEILPQFTKTVIRPAVNDADGNELAPKKEILSLNYQGFIAILTKGIQEQQAQIEEQKKVNDDQQKQIDELKAMVQEMAASNGETKVNNSQAVELSDKNAIVLNQNVPNPFAESTTINYNIPTDFNRAQIIFSTNDGKVIKTVDVTTKGKGQLNVFANDLSTGMYTYTLVVDGKTIDTKKMVKN